MPVSLRLQRGGCRLGLAALLATGNVAAGPALQVVRHPSRARWAVERSVFFHRRKETEARDLFDNEQVRCRTRLGKHRSGSCTGPAQAHKEPDQGLEQGADVLLRWPACVVAQQQQLATARPPACPAAPSPQVITKQFNLDW